MINQVNGNAEVKDELLQDNYSRFKAKIIKLRVLQDWTITQRIKPTIQLIIKGPLAQGATQVQLAQSSIKEIKFLKIDDEESPNWVNSIKWCLQIRELEGIKDPKKLKI